MSKERSLQGLMGELGVRLSQCRLNHNLTQQALAKEAGISLPTLQRCETGHSIQLDNLLKILSRLELIKNIDLLIPPTPVSPLLTLALQGKNRKRATGKRKIKSESNNTPTPSTNKVSEPWSWGTEDTQTW